MASECKGEAPRCVDTHINTPTHLPPAAPLHEAVGDGGADAAAQIRHEIRDRHGRPAGFLFVGSWKGTGSSVLEGVSSCERTGRQAAPPSMPGVLLGEGKGRERTGRTRACRVVSRVCVCLNQSMRTWEVDVEEEGPDVGAVDVGQNARHEGAGDNDACVARGGVEWVVV